ncbi:flavin reductase family protein [Rhodococcus opacus]|uniref:flavin reductase family protein n=1 Tax=Rhodococcus opacus TaxID=37919 RepID=UPI0022365A09|nr:flavin reductase family protein [Rhodococcus opacus]UZG60349.1 flavin reductase family protein [Rhodococcus opacus]
MSAQPGDTFREVLGHYATGITVITGTSPDGPLGFTCQSFSSLSLNPPLVLALPAKSSMSWPQIARDGKFCVNVLTEGQQAISATFATSGGDKFAGVSWSESPGGLPIIDGACAWIECEIETTHPGGDHLIVVGRVHHLASTADGASPLLYHRGRYSGSRPAIAQRNAFYA